jgi:hypothetical protein
MAPGYLRSRIIRTFTKYYSGDQAKKNETSVECGIAQVEETGVQDFGGETEGKEAAYET